MEHPPGSASARRRVWGLGLLAVALPAVLLATGLPSFAPGGGDGESLSLVPAPSDALRNVLLFLPLGAGLALCGVRRPTIAFSAALLSLGIEATQWLIPGRESSPWDVLANTAGGWLGGWVVAHGWSRLHPGDERQARRMHRGATGIAALLLAGGSLLFQRTLPEGPFFGHAPPDLPNLDPYPRALDRIEISGDAIVNGELPASNLVRERLLGDHRIRVLAQAAEATPGFAGIGLITDRANRGVLMIGVRRDALLYAVTTFSHRFGFDGGGRWLPGVIGTAAPGSPLEIAIERRGDDLCIAVNSPLHCGLGFRLGEGWSHLLPAEFVPAVLRPGLDLLWLAGVLAIVGYFGRGRARDPVPWCVAALAAVAVAAVGATRPPTLAEYTALATGSIAGWRAARIWRRTVVHSSK